MDAPLPTHESAPLFLYNPIKLIHLLHDYYVCIINTLKKRHIPPSRYIYVQ